MHGHECTWRRPVFPLARINHQRDSGAWRQDVLLLLCCLVFSQPLTSCCFYRKAGSQPTAPVISCGGQCQDRSRSATPNSCPPLRVLYVPSLSLGVFRPVLAQETYKMLLSFFIFFKEAPRRSFFSFLNFILLCCPYCKVLV